MNRDLRSHPRRGVRIRPLPQDWHPRFREFIDGLRCHAQSHYGTWRSVCGPGASPTVHANAIYWRSVIRYLSTLESLGTQGYDSRRGARPDRSGA